MVQRITGSYSFATKCLVIGLSAVAGFGIPATGQNGAEFPPGTPKRVLDAAARIKAKAAKKEMPNADDLKILMDWSQKIQVRSNVPVSGQTQYVPNTPSSPQMKPLDGRLEVTFRYKETTPGLTSNVSFSGWTKVKIYPKVAGNKNYFGNMGDPAAKTSSFRIEPMLESAAPMLTGQDAKSEAALKQYLAGGMKPAKVGEGTFTRQDVRPRSTTTYNLTVNKVMAAGLFTSTGQGDLMWPELSVNAEVKGNYTVTDENGTHTYDYKEPFLPTEFDPPFAHETYLSRSKDVKKWAVKYPDPLAKITLASFQNALKWGAWVEGKESFNFTAGASQFTGEGSMRLKVESGCAAEPSGPQWVTRYPDQKSLDELRPPFKEKAKAFYDALIEAGATVRIGSVFRPIERSYLMHFSYRIANDLVDPREVPELDEALYNEARNAMIAKGTPAEYIPEFSGPVDICWTHGGDGSGFDLTKSRAAADAMRVKYNIAYQPAWPRSHHNERTAMDISISWTGTLKIKNAQGKEISIGAPRNGASNTTLWEVGKSYGVIKHRTDAPHWSEDGG